MLRTHLSRVAFYKGSSVQCTLFIAWKYDLWQLYQFEENSGYLLEVITSVYHFDEHASVRLVIQTLVNMRAVLPK